MPVYKDAAFIDAALSSMLQQSFGDFELLALADPNTDEQTLTIVKACSDPRVRLVYSDMPLTIGGKLNHGIDVAQGQFIARMDADDIALEQRFERQVAYLESHPNVAVCGTWCDLFGTENWQFRTPTDDTELRFSLVFGCVFVHPSVIWRRESFEHHRLRYDTALPVTEDYDFWIRAARLVRFGAVPEVLLRYRKHERSITNLRATEGRAQYRRLQRLALQDNGYLVDEDTFEFHHRYCTAGLAGDDELPRLRHWLHWLWLSDPGAIHRDSDAVGRVCARRWFDACAAASRLDKYVIFRSSALTSLLDRAVVEQFAIDSGTVIFPRRQIPLTTYPAPE